MQGGISSQNIKEAQLDQVMKDLPRVFVLEIIYTFIVAAYFLDDIASEWILYWRLSGTLMATNMVAIRWAYLKKWINYQQTLQWGTVIALLAGCFWGSGAFLLLDFSQTENALFLCLIIITINIVPMVGVGTVPAYYFSFMIPCVLPYALHPLIYGQEDYLWYTALMLWIMLTLSFFTWQLYLSSIKQIHNQKKVDKENIAKTRFLAMANHDFGQPIGALLSCIEILQKTLVLCKQISRMI